MGRSFFPAGARLFGLRNFNMGWEIAHVFEAPDGFILVSDVEFSFGFFAAGIHGNIREFRHGNLFEIEIFVCGCAPNWTAFQRSAVEARVH